MWLVAVVADGLSERGSSFSSYKLSIYDNVNSALCSHQLGVFSSDLTSVFSMASRARLLKRPWPVTGVGLEPL